MLVIDPGMHTAMIRRASMPTGDGRWAVTGSDDKTIRVWSLADGALLRTIRLPAGPGNVGKVYAVAISPDGALIAAGGWTRWTEADPQEQIYLFDRATGALVQRIDGLPNIVAHLVFSPDGRRLVATLLSRGMRLYAASRAGPRLPAMRTTATTVTAPPSRLTDGWRQPRDGKMRLYLAICKAPIRPPSRSTRLVAASLTGLPSVPTGRAWQSDTQTRTRSTCWTAHTLAPLPRPDVAASTTAICAQSPGPGTAETLFAAGSIGPRHPGSRLERRRRGHTAHPAGRG